VVALLTDAGEMVEWVKHSAYGGPFALPAGDTDSDGDWDATDSNTILGGGAYDVRRDADLDGDVDAAAVALRVRNTPCRRRYALVWTVGIGRICLMPDVIEGMPMATTSPLRGSHIQAEASFLLWQAGREPIEIVETFGDPPVEYASLRRSCGLLDEPQIGVVEVTGSDRLEFLGRLLTRRLDDAPLWTARRTFLLNRKGRIDADITVVVLPDRLVAVCDAADAAGLVSALDTFVFSEDVQIVDRTESMHRLSMHGPGAPRVLGEASEPVDGPGLLDLTPGGATLVRIAGHRVVVERDDQTADPGLHLVMPVDAAADVETTIIEQRDGSDPERPAVRLIGWASFNIARLEGGTPIFHLDFGPDSLPHETGVLHERVSFDQRCYLGQEVVARMESRGRSKRRLVALVMDPEPAPDESGLSVQPETGSAVLPRGSDQTSSDPVGAVTSATLSPMLGGRPICLAMVRADLAAPGTELDVEAEGRTLRARVRDRLGFWSREGGDLGGAAQS